MSATARSARALNPHPNRTLLVLASAGLAYALAQTMIVPALPMESARNITHPKMTKTRVSVRESVAPHSVPTERCLAALLNSSCQKWQIASPTP